MGYLFFWSFLLSKFSAEHVTSYHTRRHPNLVSAIFTRRFHLVDLGQQTTCMIIQSPLPTLKWPVPWPVAAKEPAPVCTGGWQLVVALLVRGTWPVGEATPGAAASSRTTVPSLSMRTWKPAWASLAFQLRRPISQHWSLGVKSETGLRAQQNMASNFF